LAFNAAQTVHHVFFMLASVTFGRTQGNNFCVGIGCRGGFYGHGVGFVLAMTKCARFKP
jgi:hypothetical protein